MLFDLPYFFNMLRTEKNLYVHLLTWNQNQYVKTSKAEHSTLGENIYNNHIDIVQNVSSLFFTNKLLINSNTSK